MSFQRCAALFDSVFFSSGLPSDASVTLSKVPGGVKVRQDHGLAGQGLPTGSRGAGSFLCPVHTIALPSQRGLEVGLGGGTLKVHGVGGLGGSFGTLRILKGSV